MKTSALEAAYQRASYWVDGATDGRIRLRCGERSEPLDRLLAAAGTAQWAYITACNPASIRLAAADNAARMARLESLVAARRFRHLHGEATCDDGDWPPEPSLLVLGIEEADAVAIGRSFGQNAILAGSRGSAARLVWIEPAEVP